QQFQKLRESGYGTTFSNAYLEQGRYGEAIVSTGAEPELVDVATPDVTFTQTAVLNAPTAARASDQLSQMVASDLGGSVTLVDLDRDGDLDLLDVSQSRLRLFRNDRGTFADVTAQRGVGQPPAPAVPIAAIAGDYDNDERTDIFVLGYGANALYRQTAPWHFEDATT